MIAASYPMRLSSRISFCLAATRLVYLRFRTAGAAVDGRLFVYVDLARSCGWAAIVFVLVECRDADECFGSSLTASAKC